MPTLSSRLAFLAACVLAASTVHASTTPQHASARNALDGQRYEVAMRLYEKLIEKDPRDVDALTNLARARLYAGRTAESWRDIRRALEIRPGDEAASALAELIKMKLVPIQEAWLGMTRRDFEQMAGEPDAVVKVTGRRRLIYHDLYAYEFEGDSESADESETDGGRLVRTINLTDLSPAADLPDLLPRRRELKMGGVLWTLKDCWRYADAEHQTWMLSPSSKGRGTGVSLSLSREVNSADRQQDDYRQSHERLADFLPGFQWHVHVDEPDRYLVESNLPQDGLPARTLAYTYTDGDDRVTITYSAPAGLMQDDHRREWIQVLTSPEIRRLAAADTGAEPALAGAETDAKH